MDHLTYTKFLTHPPLGTSWLDDGPQGLPVIFGVDAGPGDGSGGVGRGGGGAGAGNNDSGVGAFQNGDDIPGLSSDYEDVTRKGAITNVRTNVTPEEFGDNLKEAGWKETTSQDGRATYYTKDGAKYSVYRQSTSTGGPTAEFTPAGAAKATLKIRLGR